VEDDDLYNDISMGLPESIHLDVIKENSVDNFPVPQPTAYWVAFPQLVKK
jgi:hypothetical protein